MNISRIAEDPTHNQNHVGMKDSSNNTRETPLRSNYCIDHADDIICDDNSGIRRRSPHSSSVSHSYHIPTKESETPRMWKSSGSAKANVSRRMKSMKNPFSPPRKISFFSLQQHFQRRSPHRSHWGSHKNGKYKKRKHGGEPDDSDVAKDEQVETVTYRAPTFLHRACYSAASGSDLEKAKLSLPQSDLDSEIESSQSISGAASEKDDEGRLPLHVLSQNKKLSISISRLEGDTYEQLNSSHVAAKQNLIASFVVDFLLPLNPAAMLAKDNNEQIPFEQALVDWINDVHNAQDQFTSQRIHSIKNFLGSTGDDTERGSLHHVVSTSFSRSRAAISSAVTLPFVSPSSATRSSTRFSDSSSAKDTSIENGALATAASSNTFDTMDSPEKGSPASAEEGRRANDGARAKSDVGPGNNADGEGNATGVSSNNDKLDRESPNDDRYRQFPSRVRLTPHVNFVLKLLSSILDALEEKAKVELRKSSTRLSKLEGMKSNGKRSRTSDVGMDQDCPLRSNEATKKNDERSHGIGTASLISAIVEQLAAIPDFVKTCLLIDDEAERHQVFTCSAMKRVVLSKYSIGKWLTSMLQSPSKKVSQRAVNYLRLLSEVSEEDKKQICPGNGRSAGEIKAMQLKHDELHEAVSVLDSLIPSMLALDEKMIEEAATTPIISRVLDKMISSPFAVSVVFFDALFLALLIVSFRASTHGFLNGYDPEDVIKWIYVTNANVFYFVIREFGKAISLCMITRRAFWVNYFWSFWNIVDILSIVLALSSTIAMRVSYADDQFVLDDDSLHLRGCLAVTTGLLWLRVLGLLKTINMQLATFVLAIVQITRDILWFLLILVAAVVSFAQMFYTLLVPASCASGENEDDLPCSQAEYYLKVYSILLGDFGDFEREDFSSVFAVLLFVFFSFMVVIVLLNVLIAIVSDSYEKCLVRSQSLFGRARVTLLAELVSFQNLLRTSSGAVDAVDMNTPVYRNWWMRQRWRKGWTQGSLIFYFVSATVVFLWIIGEVIGYLSGEKYGNIKFSIGSILVNVFLLIAIVALLSKGAAGITTSRQSTKDERSGMSVSRCCTRWYANSIQKIMLRLLGTSAETASLGKHADMEEWRGRVHHLQREMTRITAESTASTKSHVKALEHQVSLSDSRIHKELDALDAKITESEAVVMAELKETEQRIEAMIRHSMNQMISAFANGNSDVFRGNIAGKSCSERTSKY